MRLYNTLSRQQEEFAPVRDNTVRMYTCGLTVYARGHIGNFRTFVCVDVLRRALKYVGGWQMRHVMNFTDVDDKTIVGAEREKLPLREYTDRYIAAFREDAAALGIEPVEETPRATDPENLQAMADMIQQLDARGHTYRSDGSTYFKISTLPEYGRLARLDHSGIQAGARVDSDEYGKEDARDFVLWKATKPGEPTWDHGCGPGRPGWHIECSAMSWKHLGPVFDIHGGGIDLVFPHHENELAQGVCAGHSHEYAKYWLHNGFLNMAEEKMSKSVGNVALAHDLLKTVPGEALRWALLVGHYRAPLEWTPDLIEQARRSLDRLYGALRRAGDVEAGEMPPPAAFLAALHDDLNTPAAMAELFAMATRLETAAPDERAVAKGELLAAGNLMGFLTGDPEAWFQGGDADLKDKVEALIAERVAARAAKNWPEADRIRAELTALNVEVMDNPTGATWRIKEQS